jgi:hypothetical protein
MPNVTISLEEELIKSGRRYAQNHNTSLNALIRKLLEQTVKPSTSDWLDECFNLMDRARREFKGAELETGRFIRCLKYLSIQTSSFTQWMLIQMKSGENPMLHHAID